MNREDYIRARAQERTDDYLGLVEGDTSLDAEEDEEGFVWGEVYESPGRQK